MGQQSLLEILGIDQRTYGSRSLFFMSICQQPMLALGIQRKAASDLDLGHPIIGRPSVDARRRGLFTQDLQAECVAPRLAQGLGHQASTPRVYFPTPGPLHKRLGTSTTKCQELNSRRQISDRISLRSSKTPRRRSKQRSRRKPFSDRPS